MIRFKKLSIFAVAAAMVIAAGCSKKVVKQPEPVVEPPKPVVEEVKPVEPPKVVVPTIDTAALIREKLSVPMYFDYDQFELRSDALDRMAVVGPFLKEFSTIRIMLEGHADERGSSEYNIGLGDNRAKAVEKWLQNYGIDAGRLETTSFGKERPVSTGCGEDDACHQKNRRVEIRVTGR